MTQRDAVDVEADALMEVIAAVINRRLDRQGGSVAEDAQEIGDAVLEALRSASNSGAEAMREAAARHLRDMAETSNLPLDAALLQRAAREVASLPLPTPGALASPWRVRKLIWSWQDPYHVSRGAHYTIENGEGGALLWGLLVHGRCVEAGRFATVGEAKAAAQADFEARIRSAIEPDLPTHPASKDT